MRDSFFKMFGSVKLVQEVSRSSPSSQPQSSTHLTNQSSTAAPPPPPPQVSHHPLSIDTNVHPTTTTTTTTLTTTTTTPTAAAAVERNSEPPITQSPMTPSSHSSYWPPHSVQPIPLTFNSYTPATPSLPMWISSYSSKQPAARGIRELLFGSSATTTTTTTTQPSCASAPMTSTTSSSMTAPRNTHTRRGSRSIRRSRQLSIKGHGRRPSRTWSSSAVMRPLDSKDKSKSQKLLCLWPLPVITRYTIALSLLVSAFRFANILSATCSAPSFVIYRHEWLNLALSPFLFDWSLHGLLVFGWNVLILGLFEESLTHMLGGTRRFVRVLVSIVISVCLLRQALGYLFSKSTGWAVPLLFFSDSVHECNQGIAPFLFALLMVQSLSIDDKYIVLYGDADPNHKLTVRKVTLQLLMCLVNYLVKNILWWSLTGLLTGYMAAIVIQATILREKRGITTATAPTTPTNTTWDDKDVPPAFEEFPRATPLWRLLLSAFRKAFTVIAVTLPLLLLFNAYYYSQEGLVDSTMLNQLSHDRYMFTFVVMTAPRRGEPPLLSRTIESYLANWPVDPEPGSLHSRLQLMVYTHFSNHSQFDAARERFSNDLKGQRYIKWVREEGNEMNQRLHVSKALQLATESFQSTYVALVEDDFPICGSDAWHQLEHVVYQANKHAANHCGVFVGTGGSGLFLKPETAQLVSRLLLQYGDTPPDIVIQKCLRGELAECSHCQDSLVTSKTLLMYHIGFNTSTSTDRVYKKDEFQCGWRHPFNGDPSVITL